MSSTTTNPRDSLRLRIKPSLHAINCEDLSHKLSQKWSKNLETTEQNSHSIPFKVNHNQLMPHLTHLSSFTCSDKRMNDENQSIKAGDNRLLEAKGNNSEMRPDSCPNINDFPQNQMFLSMNDCKTNSNLSLNSLKLDYNYKREDNYNLKSHLLPSNESFFSTPNSQLNDYQYINQLNLWPDSSSRKTHETNRRTERYCQSCPSSPLMKRLQNESTYSPKPMASQFLRKIALNFHQLHGSDVFLDQDFTKAERHSCTGLVSNSYAFISQQITIGLKFTIQIISLEECNGLKASFIFGLTNANPSTLSANDLPTNGHDLIQRKDEYWALVDSFCDNCNINDKLTFLIDSKGFVYFQINSNRFTVLFPIKNHNQNLWAFFNIIGTIKAIKLVDNKCNTISNPIENYRKSDSKLSHFNKNSASHLYKCIKCFSDYANTAFYKCGHKYFCFNCSKQYFNSTNKCPFCFQIICDLLIVFP